MIQFSSAPSRAQIGELRRRGVKITSFVPETALVVAAADDASWDGLGLTYVGRLDELDKLSSALTTSDGEAFVIVEFHPDVDMADARALIAERNLHVNERENLLPNQLLASGPSESILRLAEWDEVAYVFPASPDLVNNVPVVACAGAVVEEGPIAQYVKVGPGWPRTGPDGSPVALNYFLGQLTSKLPAEATQSEILRALNEWTRHGNLTFTPGSSATAARTIHIFFASRAHGDPYPFDGQGAVLAHTFYPPPNSEPIAGDMHLDADENWRIGASTDLFSVVLHEAGHALGLAHSDRPASVMYPFYKLTTALHADDIAGIQDLYGVPTQTSTPDAPPPIPPFTPTPAPTPAPAPTPTAPTPDPTPAPVPPPPTPPTPAPLSLTIASPVTTSSATVAITGTASGGSGTLRVTWTSDRGSSGAASGSTNWTIASLPLSTGSNRVTITVTDTASRSASQSISITRAAPQSTDTTAPSLTIASPTATIVSTTASTISLSGTAADNVGVVAVRWSNAFGNTGDAAGTANWQISSVPLLIGTNKITVRAFDAAGNFSWRLITVVRR